MKSNAQKEWSSEYIESRSPATGEVLGTSPIAGDEQVAAAVCRGRQAFSGWSRLPVEKRCAELTKFRRNLAKNADAVADLLSKETGKPLADALTEVMVALMQLSHAVERAPAVLRSQKVSTGFLPNFQAEISYQGLGVVGVIGPWNYPVYTPMGSIAYALAAGNTVVFKPSEHTPLVGQLLGEIAGNSMSFDNVFSVIAGDGATGASLAGSLVDKIAFTGSVATGRRVMQIAGEKLTPVLLELGGKDALIVLEDADLEAAAEAAVFGAMHNSGQACVSIERCYVVGSVYQEFLALVQFHASKIRWGGDNNDDIGPLISQGQVDVVKDHIADAQAKGANVTLGGIAGIRDNFVPPTVVVDVTHKMKIMTEETFGPVLPIMRAQDADEAFELANDTEFGLGSALFTSEARAHMASRLRTGATSVNSVLAFGAIPSLPFGGVGHSGFGRIHGDAGLLEFSRIKSTATKRFSLPTDMDRFGVPAKRARTVIKNLFAGGPIDRASSSLRKFLAGR